MIKDFWGIFVCGFSCCSIVLVLLVLIFEKHTTMYTHGFNDGMKKVRIEEKKDLKFEIFVNPDGSYGIKNLK